MIVSTWPAANCMHLLTRFVLAEFAKWFVLMFAACASVMMAVACVEQFLERDLSIRFTATVVPYLWPLPARFALPCACIFASCSVFGRMAADNELLAVRAAGLSLLHLVWPVLVITIPMSLLCVRLEDLGLTWSHNQVQRAIVDSAGDVAYDILRKRRVYRTQEFQIVVQEVEGRRLIEPIVTIYGEDGETSVFAKEGSLESAYPSAHLRLTVSQGTVITPYGYEIHFRDDWQHTFPLQTKLGAAFDIHRIREQQQEIVDLRKAIQAARSNSDSRADAQRIEQLEKTLANSERWLERLEARFHKKWCTAFSCLFGTMIGIPTAILLRTADLARSFFLGFIPIVVVYYPLTSFWYELAKGGNLPESSVWTCNAVLGVVGARLLWKVR